MQIILEILQNIKKQAHKLKRCATLRWNLRTAVKLAHSQNCRPQSRKKSKWNLCNCDCCKTCTQRPLQNVETEKFRGVISRKIFHDTSANCAKLSKTCKICKICQMCTIVQSCAKLCKICKIVQNVQKCAKCSKLCKICKIV